MLKAHMSAYFSDRIHLCSVTGLVICALWTDNAFASIWHM